MAEKNQMDFFSTLMGEQGQDALQMVQRMERLKRLMGTAKPTEQPVPAKRSEIQDIFSCGKKENMILAAIPFLDQEYQRGIYVLVRLMEMRRVLGGDLLESREKMTGTASIRRRKLLEAVQPYLSDTDQTQLQHFIRIMDMKAIMELEGTK